MCRDSVEGAEDGGWVTQGSGYSLTLEPPSFKETCRRRHSQRGTG